MRCEYDSGFRFMLCDKLTDRLMKKIRSYTLRKKGTKAVTEAVPF